MKPNYKNWVPNGMIAGFAAGTAVLAAANAAAWTLLDEDLPESVKLGIRCAAGVSLAGCGAATVWLTFLHNSFSYHGKRQLSKQIIEGTADYVSIPDGGTGLDVGCGSGALTIACARRNPHATMIGVDRWGKEYASFSQKLCEKNAKAEHVENVSFQKGDAVHLDFPDEAFDAVTSNYVYHNISGKNKQELLRETLRVLKKGGTFAIHDIMSKARYGDMKQFVEELKEEGYEEVRLIPTDHGVFMGQDEAIVMALNGSSLLVGKK